MRRTRYLYHRPTRTSTDVDGDVSMRGSFAAAGITRALIRPSVRSVRPSSRTRVRTHARTQAGHVMSGPSCNRATFVPSFRRARVPHARRSIGRTDRQENVRYDGIRTPTDQSVRTRVRLAAGRTARKRTNERTGSNATDRPTYGRSDPRRDGRTDGRNERLARRSITYVRSVPSVPTDVPTVRNVRTYDSDARRLSGPAGDVSMMMRDVNERTDGNEITNGTTERISLPPHASAAARAGPDSPRRTICRSIGVSSITSSRLFFCSLSLRSPPPHDSVRPLAPMHTHIDASRKYSYRTRTE